MKTYLKLQGLVRIDTCALVVVLHLKIHISVKIHVRVLKERRSYDLPSIPFTSMLFLAYVRPTYRMNRAKAHGGPTIVYAS